MTRCVNIDWLEVYALEPISDRRDAEFFRRDGWLVHEREYGTPMYHEMFTLTNHHDFTLFEIRRNPKSRNTQGGLFDINGCHIRCTNRACYIEGIAKILQDFMLRYNFVFSRISRIDLCLDFKRFDSHDYPQSFVRRFMEGKYSKINQCVLTAHGTDNWNGRVWNSLSWGQRKSMIRTRFYCKSLELQEVKDKPYIRQAWFAAGLIQNPLTLEQLNPDGTVYVPQIWRLEFQISSSVKRWFTIHPDGNDKVYRSIRHTLDMYTTRQQLLNVFASLTQHYFHFKYYDSTKRKDRCRDKDLFFFTDADTHYKIERENVANVATVDYADRVLLRRLEYYQSTHSFNRELVSAAQVIIDALKEQSLRFTTAEPFSRERLLQLQEAISTRASQVCKDPIAVMKFVSRILKESTEKPFI